MLTIREVIKTFYNALLQRLKKHRGNWEQNDPTADDYIKNRPFYTDETNKETVVKTKTFTATSSYWWGSPFAFIPVVGETYKITFDDKEYICIGKIADWGGKYIGNISIDDDGPDTGEPFWYYWYDSYEYGMVVRYQGKHTITIEKIKIVKIDKRYLPDDLNVDLDLAPVATSGDYWDLENIPETYSDVVRYGTSQSLTTAQKAQARTNIGAAATSDLATVANTGDYNDLKNKPCSKIITYSGETTLSYSGGQGLDPIISYSNSGFSAEELANNEISWSMYVGNVKTVLTGYAKGQYRGHNTSTNWVYYSWGNMHLYNTLYEDTGEDWFVFATVKVGGSGRTTYYYHKDVLNNSQPKLYAKQKITTITQLNEEFIPNTIPRIGEVNAIIDNKIDQAKDYVALIDQVNGDTYLVSMQDGELVSDIGVQDIKIVQMPNKTSYIRGEYFDPTGMIVTAICQDGSVKELENYTYTKDYFAMGTTSIDIVYKEAGIVHKDTVQVTVSEFDPAAVLVDFTYTDNGDGTYTITDWKGTLNGTPSTEIIIPNYGCIIV